MRAIQIAGCGLTLAGLLLLQGCGGSSSSSAASSFSSSSSFSSGRSSSLASSSAAGVSSANSSVSSSLALVGAAETHLGAGNLPPDSGVVAANMLTEEELSPENTQASLLATEDLPPL